MNKIFLSFVFCFLSIAVASAQSATYHLPKTALKISVLVEKKSYTPGRLSEYANRFLKKNVEQETFDHYRIINQDIELYAIPDSSRIFEAKMENKLNITSFSLTEDNILLGINADGKGPKIKEPFVPAPKPEPLDPYKYLSQEIVSTGSKLKMAELCANEIFDIRESINELTRGQADYMPKDGLQLEIMLKNLSTQEKAIRQFFEGVTTTDTLEHVFIYVPEKEKQKEILYRFSSHFGMVDTDDLSGEPYYAIVEDLHSMPEYINEPGKKAPKDETGIWISLPGKVRFSLSNGEKALKTLEFSASQFGEIENLNDPLFSKKVKTTLLLHPYNGGIEKIESVQIK